MIWMGAWRVNGNLSVSRAIGDAKQKHLVVGDADVKVFDLDGSEDYLVVACDGVWDVLNGEEIVKCVNTHLASPGGSKQTVAKAIAEFSRAECSGDNMTVIVVFFSGFSGPTVSSSANSTSETTPTQSASVVTDGNSCEADCSSTT